ncbi:MAG: helix-turn-helix transcriptional regulator [Anaerolineales bacterium]|nr:helix-turn-helix transcriptional regulator [Anaerolineales bacterium]
MSTPILATKLYVPRLLPKVVLRPRLVERLNEGLVAGRKLTLISAAAGFGKTTLICEWVTACARPVAWVSLDDGDNDLVRFLTYLVAAIQTRNPHTGVGVLELLQSPQLPPTEAILTALLNEIATVSEDFIVVLDDYHVIEASPVDQALTFLVEHLPPPMHLVIASREDPPLPLARLRARGQMTEVRAADLRFSLAETLEFLNQAMGLSLAAGEIAALEARTEGWIAGLQMAGLSLLGRADSAQFIRAFTGSHRYVLDYLVEEVLQRQPDGIRTFLFETAILDRLCGPLCDAVTGQENGREMLAALERGNLFVIPLDDTRQWYRYHHLFAEVLQARLREAQPALAPALHRRASDWYERNGLPGDAIRHALAAADFERAASLIELQAGMMRGSGEDATWKGWVQMLPVELVRTRPVLSVYFALTLLPGEMDRADSLLRAAEHWLTTTTAQGEQDQAQGIEWFVANEEELLSLPGTLAITRAYHAGALGNLADALHFARQALELLPKTDWFWRGGAAALLGIAYWTSGDLESAHRSIATGMADAELVSGISATTGYRFLLADLRLAQGRLRDAIRTCQQGLHLVAEHGGAVPQGAADLHVILGEVQLEQNALAAAAQSLLRSKELGPYAMLSESRHRLAAAQARLLAAQGDLDSALDLYAEADRLYLGGPTPDVHPLAALKARVWLQQGRVAEALEWVRERNLSVADDLHYLREFEHITLARILLAEYRNTPHEHLLKDIQDWLARLLPAAEAGGRLGHAIEILSLQSLAHAARGDSAQALASLGRAVTLAEPEGFALVFVNEGPPMAALLRQVKQRGGAGSYVDRLLTAFAAVAEPLPVTSSLIEPLSERELEVLRLLATELSGPEIADRLVVSLNTLRTHTQRIYGKLGVSNRRAAVLRAQELQLI